MKWNTPAEVQKKSGIPVRGTYGGRRGNMYRSDWTPTRAVDEALERVTWVYRCVDAIAGNAARMRYLTRKGDSVDGEPVETQAAQRYNVQPNEGENSFVFRYRLSSQLLLSQKGVFLHVVRTNGGDVASLTLLPSEHMTIVPDRKHFIKRYELQDDYIDDQGRVQHKLRKFNPEEIIWIRTPHPNNPYRAIIPLSAVGMAVETDWLAKSYNRNFMLNDGRPGGIVVIKGDMEDADAQEIQSRFSGGVGRAGRVTVLTGDGADFVDTAVTPRDAQYQETRQLTKEEILTGFGVPESVLGNASKRTLDNAEIERLVFWQETMIPHLDKIMRALDELIDDDTIFFAYDLSRVDVLQRMEMKRQEYRLKEYDAGVTDIDEYREATGRPAIPGGAGKVMLRQKTKIPFMMSDGSEIPDELTGTVEEASPVGHPEDGSVEEDPETDEREREDDRQEALPNTDTTPTPTAAPSKDLTDEQFEALRIKVGSDYDRWTEIAVSATERLADRMKRVLIEKVGGPHYKKAAYTDAAPHYVLTELIFNEATWMKQYQDDLTPVVRGAFQEANAATAKALKVEPTSASGRVFSGSGVVKQLGEAVSEAMKAGGHVDYVKENLSRAIDDVISDPEVTNEARKTVVASYNAGIDQAVRAADSEKMWVKLEDGPGDTLDRKILPANGSFKTSNFSMGAPRYEFTNSVLVPIQGDSPVV